MERGKRKLIIVRNETVKLRIVVSE